MSETIFKLKVLKCLNNELPGAWVYKCSDRFHSGIPDLFILYQGHLTCVELKFGKGKATKLQEVVLGRIRAAGGITAVCRDLTEVRKVLETLKRRTVNEK